MYRYRAGGVEVLLANGYEEARTKYGDSIRFRDLSGLGLAIAHVLVRKPGRLKTAEFRYLRKACELSQMELGGFLDVEGQTVSLWERGNSDIPLIADAVLRVIASERIGSGSISLQDSLLRVRSESPPETELVFAYFGEWQEASEQLALRQTSLVHSYDIYESSRMPVGDTFLSNAVLTNHGQTKTLTYRVVTEGVSPRFALAECA